MIVFLRFHNKVIHLIILSLKKKNVYEYASSEIECKRKHI